MNDPNDSHLSAALTEMTDWRGADAALWHNALVRSREEPARPAGRIVRWPFIGALVAAVVVVMAGAVAMRLGSPSPRGAPLSVAAKTPSSSDVLARDRWEPPSEHVFESSSRAGLPQDPAAVLGDIPILADAFADESYTNWPTDSSSSDRAIIRQAEMSLSVVDVRAAFAAASSLADALAGEFIESATMSGEGAEARATVALRISAARLDAVMQSARRLGEVTHEQTNASDVTDRLADLSAQVRNERRIEAELLGLLDTRKDAPLADILKVRQSLDEVRLKIERLEAQRAGLGKRVELSALRIDIAPKPKQEPEPEPQGAAFLTIMSDAFGRGGDALGASIAWIVEVAVGGLALWLPLLVFGVWAYRSFRWRATWA